jgi:hypothetical protein
MNENKKILYIDMDGVLVDLKTEFDKWFERHPHLIDKYKLSTFNILLIQISNITINWKRDIFAIILNIMHKNISMYTEDSTIPLLLLLLHDHNYYDYYHTKHARWQQ